ncbi:hypothetical protein PS15m_012356 [Mucor circinelloides]
MLLKMNGSTSTSSSSCCSSSLNSLSQTGSIQLPLVASCSQVEPGPSSLTGASSQPVTMIGLWIKVDCSSSQKGSIWKRDGGKEGTAQVVGSGQYGSISKIDG